MAFLAIIFQIKKGGEIIKIVLIKTSPSLVFVKICWLQIDKFGTFCVFMIKTWKIIFKKYYKNLIKNEYDVWF